MSSLLAGQKPDKLARQKSFYKFKGYNVKYFKWAAFLTAFFYLNSCTNIIETFIGDQSYDVINLGQKDFALMFSHNIHGETHPCGCRHFPLGGLPQVAGLFKKVQEDHELFYVDTGDTFFDSATMTEGTEKSSLFKAESLAKGLSDLGLKYWTPGDFDLASGLGFLKEITQKNKLGLLVANFSQKNSIPHKEFVIIAKGPHRIFLTGIVHPDVMIRDNDKNSFLRPAQFLPSLLEKIKKKGFDSQNPFHRLVLLSHSGYQKDVELAKAYPDFDWIIGSHTQSFFREPKLEGQTKIVQVLSRNHYVGQITFNMKKDKSADTYKIHEIRDNLKDNLKPNPFISFIEKHKEKARNVQLKEQELVHSDGQTIKYTTTSGCIECHEKQGQFWRSTSHSLAYATLIKAKEETNLSCVKCHSLGEGESKGFFKVKDIVEVDKEKLRKVSEDAHKKAYFSEVTKALAPIHSVRKLSPKDRVNYSQKWENLDRKFGVNRNFANVQCLNCHSQDSQHPWGMKATKNISQRLDHISKKCLDCHNSDQSPEWFSKLPNGLPGKLDQKTFKKKVKQMSCPKGLD